MDYRRRYLRRLANQSQQNQVEEKTAPEKVEEKQTVQNVYLQRLLEKKGPTTGTTTINITSVNESIPSFKTNIRDIFSTEENKQRAIKYVIRRNEEKYGQRSPISVNNNEEESNPVLSNKYYKNSRYSTNNKNDASTNEFNQEDTNKNYTESKGYHYYTRRNRNYGNTSDTNNNNQDNKNDNFKKEETSSTTFVRKRFQISVSTTNINQNNNKEKEEENTNNNTNNNNSVYRRRNRQNNVITHNNSPKENKDQENETKPPRYRYIRGYGKKEETEQNDKNNEKKDENKSKDKKNTTSVHVNVNVGKNYSFGRPEEKNNYNYSNIKDNTKSTKNINNEEINDIAPSKRYTYARQRYKYGDTFNQDSNRRTDKKKDNVKENVIELKILPNNDNSRFKRKYGRFSSNNDNENLSFKDEKELMDYLKRKYEQDKIIELLNLKVIDKERKKIENELNDTKRKLD